MKEFPRSITVDYGLYIYDMIRAGRFDWHNQCIGHRWFPLIGGGKRVFTPELIIGTEWQSLQEVEDCIRGRGCYPGRIEHLLALAASGWEPGFVCDIMAPAAQLRSRQEGRRAWISYRVVLGELQKELHMGWIGNHHALTQIFLAVKP